MEFYKCVLFLFSTGILGFVLGRIIPKNWFKWEFYPFKSFPFEQNGKVYAYIGIRFWHDRLPDMSRMLPGLLPPKNLSGNYRERLPLMIRETCAAEFVHVLLSFCGLYCFGLWKGLGGAVVSALFFIGNLPFVFIQRYNRPRLLKLYEKLGQTEMHMGGAAKAK